MFTARLRSRFDLFTLRVVGCLLAGGAGCLDDAPEQFNEEVTRKRQVQKAGKDSVLVEAQGLAHYRQAPLDEGTYRSVTEIAAAEGMDLGQANRIVRLT